MFTSERGATWAPGRAGAGAKRVLVTEDRVGTGRTLLDSTDVQGGRFELDLLPPQVHKLGRAETCVQCIRRYASPQTQEGR